MEEARELQMGVQEAIAAVRDRSISDSFAKRSAIKCLEDYECWEVVVDLLTWFEDQDQIEQKENLTLLAKITYHHLSQVSKAEDVVRKIVKQFSLTYEEFCRDCLSYIVRDDDFSGQATFLDAALPSFQKVSDRIECLEHLCLLFEKKIYNDSKLAACYEQLLETSPTNKRALRYFKVAFSQTGEWKQVAKVLRQLLDSVEHPIEKFRVAQELAALHHYQLDQSSESLKILQTHCKDSPLDYSKILFDVNHSLEDWTACVDILDRERSESSSEVDRAVLSLKIGKLLHLAGDYEKALVYLDTAKNNPLTRWDAVEELFEVFLRAEDWQQISSLILWSAEMINNPRSKETLKELQERIRHGMEAQD